MRLAASNRVAQMPNAYPHPAALPPHTLHEQCDVRRTRRSGPGGQHRNKVETAVVLLHRPTGITAQASERRSQAENLGVALRRLSINLALEVRMQRDSTESPSPLWQSRCRGGKLTISAAHEDFPAILAEALDAIAAHDMHLPDAAGQLGCTTSQLTKLLKAEPRALELVNRGRRERNLVPLR